MVGRVKCYQKWTAGQFHGTSLAGFVERRLLTREQFHDGAGVSARAGRSRAPPARAARSGLDVLERQSHGEIELHVHALFGGRDRAMYCAVYECPRGRVTHVDGRVKWLSPLHLTDPFARQLQTDHLKKAVLVDVRQPVEFPERITFDVLPCVVWLQSLDGCLRGRAHSLNPWQTLFGVVGDRRADRELALSLFAAQRMGQVVERSSQVLNAVTGHKAVFDEEVVGDTKRRLNALARCVGIWLYVGPESSGVVIREKGGAEVVEVVLGPLELGPVARFRWSYS